MKDSFPSVLRAIRQIESTAPLGPSVNPNSILKRVEKTIGINRIEELENFLSSLDNESFEKVCWGADDKDSELTEIPKQIHDDLDVIFSNLW